MQYINVLLHWLYISFLEFYFSGKKLGGNKKTLKVCALKVSKGRFKSYGDVPLKKKKINFISVICLAIIHHDNIIQQS